MDANGILKIASRFLAYLCRSNRVVQAFGFLIIILIFPFGAIYDAYDRYTHERDTLLDVEGGDDVDRIVQILFLFNLLIIFLGDILLGYCFWLTLQFLISFL